MRRTTVGTDAEASLTQAVYRLIHQHPSWLVEDIAGETGVSPAEVEAALDLLERLGLLAASTTAPGGYSAIDPEAALSRLFATEERQVTLHQQQLARTRESIRTIMSGFMRLRAEERGVVEIETLRSGSQVNAFIDDAVSMVQAHESTMHPGGIPPIEVMDDMLLRDQEVVSRGIQVRTLYARHIAEVPHMAEYLTEITRLGMEVRLAAHLPLRMLIFDEGLALLPIDPQDSSRGAFAIRGTELVRSLQTFFDFCWHDAVPLDRGGPDGAAVDVPLTAQEHLIIRMLAAGVKDETIARQLGVSARTLSRTISGLLDSLGVQTRFQAALKISEMGILEPSGS
ncbi:LuxR C-terminal-related transcriptional regulator [Kitasatospora sp. NPDC093550]|uniref:helix-turn-helix transcriptional regulator n=1 Tax=Kitasatospora sp. NPDC093550 TaxID=3364089 RepID=UPI0037F40F21